MSPLVTEAAIRLSRSPRTAQSEADVSEPEEGQCEFDGRDILQEFEEVQKQQRQLHNRQRAEQKLELLTMYGDLKCGALRGERREPK